jgi:glycosyltransferase involved in cell wall biosynthesis
MTRICVINPNFYKSSGVTNVIKKLYQNIDKNHSESIEHYFIDCRYGDEVSEANWTPPNKQFTFKLMSNNPIKLLKESISFIKWIKNNNINIIHIHHRRLAAVISILNISMKCKLLYTGHLTYSKSSIFKILMRMPCISISDSVTKNLEYTTSSKDITFLGNPVDFISKKTTIPTKCFDTAISIGRLTKIKGMNYIIDAYHILHEKGVKKKLLIVGEGEEKEALQQQINAYSLQEYIALVGYTSNINQYIEQSAFTILHSSIEGLPLVIMESANLYRPSLVTDVDGSRDTISLNINLPNLTEFSNVEELVSTLEIWFSNPSAIIQEGIKFHDFLKDMCATEKVTNGYYQKYKELVNE